MTLEQKSLTKENIDLAKFSNLFESIYTNNHEINNFEFKVNEKQEIGKFICKVISDIIAGKKLSDQEKVEEIGAFLKNPYILINNRSVAKIILASRNNSYEEVRKINDLIKANLIKQGITNTNNNIINSTKIKNLITIQKQPEFDWRKALIGIIGVALISSATGAYFAFREVNQNKSTKNANSLDQNEQLADRDSGDQSFAESKALENETQNQHESSEYHKDEFYIPNGYRRWNKDAEYDKSLYILNAGSEGSFAGGGIYESVLRKNKLFIQEELYGSQGIMQLYQPALLKLNPEKLVFFGNYPEMTFGDGILNTGQIPLNGTKEFYVDFSHNKSSNHLDGSNESEKVKIYAKLENPTNTPITLTLQSALLFGTQDSSYADIAGQAYMTQVEDLNTNNVKNRGPGLLLAYHRNYSPNKFAGRGVYLNHSLIKDSQTITIPPKNSILFSAYYLRGENMGSLKFGVNEDTQNNSGHIKITTAVGKNPISAFAKPSPINRKEKFSRRSSGVFAAESEGSLITDKTIMIRGGRFIVNNEKVDRLGGQLLGFFSTRESGSLDISTPKILDLSNVSGSNAKSSEGSNYGDFHVKKTVYQRFSTKQPTRVRIGFLPTQLHYAVQLNSNNQQRDTSPQKNREGENKIEHRDIVEILVKSSDGQILTRDLKVIGMTPKGQAFVNINLPAGESILQSSYFNTTNNTQGDNGKVQVVTLD